MSQFLYFIPGLPRNQLPREEVLKTFAAAALRDLLRSDKTWSADSVTFNPLSQDGPGGKTGTIFACLPGGMAIDGFAVDYRPNEQTWIEIGNAWLGWYTNNQPTERSLRKSPIVSGYSVMLNDDSAWVAPVIRCQPQGARITLPRAIGLSPTGERVMRVKPHYQFWQDIADKLWDFRWGKIQLTNIDLLDAASNLLSLNYTVGPHEIDALGLFELVDPGSEHTANWSDIIAASYDWPVVQELIDAENAKKKDEPPAPVDSVPSAGSVVETQLAAV